MKAANVKGRCRSCGADLVDWDRVQKKDLRDVQYAFSMLKQELIRHHFWHVQIDQRAINHALRKGRKALLAEVATRLRESVGPAEPNRDGRQTPKDGKLVYYAQHATACCCRKCIEYWHGIEQGRDLEEHELAYFAELIVRFIDERLPDLPETGQKIPYIRRAQNGVEPTGGEDERDD